MLPTTFEKKRNICVYGIRQQRESLLSRSGMPGAFFKAFPKQATAWSANRRGLTLVTDGYLLNYIYSGSRIDVVSIRHERVMMPTPDVDSDSDLEGDPDTAGHAKPSP